MQSTGSVRERGRQNFGQPVTMPPIVGEDGVQREYVFRGGTAQAQQDIEAMARQLNRLSLQHGGIIPLSALPGETREKFDRLVSEAEGTRVMLNERAYPCLEVRETGGSVSFEPAAVTMAPGEVISRDEWQTRVSMVNFDIPAGTTAHVAFEGGPSEVPMGGRFRFYWQGVPPRDLADFVARADDCLVPNNDGISGTWTGFDSTGRMITLNIRPGENTPTSSDTQAAIIYNLAVLLNQRSDLAEIATPVGDLNPLNVRPRPRLREQ
ncbi:MAG: hypothetical protein PHQ80_01165 [Candidatus ainarchaeum sp.]|nr:hypothetical protein [Candidatus ainarchaeum sp.]MDD5095958.1 hypothetical protein [Candidatus ainarchaeum sp.]